MLLASLFQELGSICDRLCIPNFDLRKGNFNFQNFIKIVRTLIVVKLKKPIQ